MKRSQRFRAPAPEYPVRHDVDKRKVSRKAEVLHVDEMMIVVAKPPRVSLDLAWDDEPTVIDQLIAANEAGEDEALLPVYMMEPMVSGVAILARGEAAFEQLRASVTSGDISITCDVLIRGRATAREGTIKHGVRLKKSGSGLLCIDDDAGDAAVTQWTLKDSFVGMAYLECRPSPADPNILRVHLQHAGLPLLVDAAYGGGTELRLSSFKAGYRPSPRHPERPLLERVSLHVAELSMKHPQSGELTPMTAELPKDFRAALHQLERHGRIPS